MRNYPIDDQPPAPRQKRKPKPARIRQIKKQMRQLAKRLRDGQ